MKPIGERVVLDTPGKNKFEFMKLSFSIILILISILFFSCKTKKEVNRNFNVIKKNQNLDFTHLYSEALKQKMLQNYNNSIYILRKCLDIKPESSASAYELSNLYLETNKLDSAKFYSDIAYKINPNNEWYVLQRANLAKLGYYKLIYEKMYEKLVNLKPTNINYLYEYALINFKSLKNDSVLSIADKIEKLVGVNESISFLRNHVYYRQKNYKAVINEYNKLINIFPDSVKYVEMLANFYYTTNDYEKSLKVYKENLNKFDNNHLFHLGISRIYVAKKQFKKAYPFLIIGLKAKNVNIKSKFEIAEVLIDSKNIFTVDSIELIYEQLIENSHKNSEITKEYLDYLLKNKKLTKAEKVCLKFIKKQPQNFPTWETLFNILVNQERYSDLEIYCQRALEYFPNQSIVYFFKGFALFSQNKFKRSTIFFKTGFDLSFDDKNLKLEFLLYLSEAFHNIQEHNKSDFYFEEYLKIDKTNAYLLNNYAYYLTKRNINFERAKELSFKSLEIEPFNSSFLDTYAWIFYTAKDYKKALIYIKKSYKYGGNKKPVIIEHYGDILLKLGRVEEAIKKWKESYGINESNINLKNKIDKLSK